MFTERKPILFYTVAEKSTAMVYVSVLSIVHLTQSQIITIDTDIQWGDANKAVKKRARTAGAVYTYQN